MRPAHHLLTVSGIFGSAASPLEQFQFGIRLEPYAWTDVAQRVSWLNDRATYLQTSPLWSAMPATAIITNLRVAEIGDDGHVLMSQSGTYQQTDKGVSIAGSSSGPPPMPLQTALVVSLQTNRAGASGKGRCFLPWPALALSADFRITAVQAQKVADDFAAFVKNINSAYGPGPGLGDVVVASGGTKANGYVGYLSRVTKIRVGRAPDTLRSRRGDLAEGYVTADV